VTQIKDLGARPKATPDPEPPVAHTRTAISVAMSTINWILPIATVGLMAYFTVLSPVFLTPGNLVAVATQNASTFIVAVVFAMLMMAGYVDLSVGSTMGLIGVVAGLTMNASGLIPGLLVGIGIGLAVGLINGFLISFLNFSPIVVTLGGLAAARGLAQYLGQDSIYGFPAKFVSFGSGSILGISYLAIVAIIVCVAAIIVMTRYPFGRKVISIGVNRRAAFLVGIRVKPIVFTLYVLTGLAVALASLLEIARLDSAPSGTLGSGFEVTVLTAVLLGGVPFDGGKGSIWRVIVGTWLIGVLKNGLTLLNISTQLSGIITGGVLVLAAALEAFRYYVRQNK
jgi:ribose/xylose/arabinose/galactoside ABC-type transport system permease subunit